MANLTSSLTVKLIDDVSRPAKTVADALKAAETNAKAVAKAMAGAGATDKFTKSLSGLKLSAKDIDQVKTAWQGYSKAAGLAGDASKWTKTQAADVRAWEKQTVSALRNVKKEQTAFYREQAKASRMAPAAMAASASGQKGPGGAHGIGKGIVGLAAGHKANEFRRSVSDKYRDADDTLRYQGAMADLSPAEMASRQRQALTLGPQAGVKPTDVLHAQQTLAGRGVKKDFVEPFTEQLTNYARAMNTDMASAAKTLETIIFSTNQHVEDASSASKTMQRQIDIAVKAAKLGGLDDSDIQMASKFGGATGHAGGFKNETMFGIFAALSRAGYRGDEGGVATRAIASKLVSPSAKGMDALSVMGVDYDKFAKSGPMTPEGLEGMQQRRFGKGLSAKQKSELQAIFDDGEKVGDRDQFISAVSEVLSQSFEKNKKGETKAQDAQKIAKLAGDFYKNAIQSVDIEGLLMAILEKSPTLQQLNSLFTLQHGGKVSALAENVGRLKEILEAINHVPEGFAQGIGDKRMEGFAGSMNKAEAAIEAFTIRVGEANSAALKFTADMVAKAATTAANASDGTLQKGATVVGTLGLISAGAGLSAFLGGAGVGGSLGAGLAAGGASLPFFAAGAGAWSTYKGMGGGQTDSENAITREIVELKQTIENLDKILARKARWDEDGTETQGKRDAAQKRLDAINVDTGDLDKAKKAAEDTKSAVDALDTTVTPNIATGPIDTALSKARELKALLDGIGSSTANLGARIQSLGKIQRGNFSFGGVQGE